MNLLHPQNTKLIVFDFDGTIADTAPGILDSHRFAFKSMGRVIPPENEIRNVIGGNLLEVYRNIFSFLEEDARKAIALYRERYSTVGIHKAELYNGIVETLISLKNNGYKLCIATLKAEPFAISMSQELGIFDLFDEICGMDKNDVLNKSSLIDLCCERCECGKDATVLVGDSVNDLKGAQQAGVNFVGVTYGYGFIPGFEYDFFTVDKPNELLKIYCS